MEITCINTRKRIYPKNRKHNGYAKRNVIVEMYEMNILSDGEKKKKEVKQQLYPCA